MSEWTKEISATEITSNITCHTVTFADKFGDYLTNSNDNKGAKMTTSQLRRFYGEVKRIQMLGYEEHKSDFILLKPKLAYAVGRAGKGNKIKDFYEVIAYMIDNVKDKNGFENFIKVFEAIVAYHKKYEVERK